MTKNEDIQAVARRAAEGVLNVAIQTAKDLAASTSKDISYIQRDVVDIKTSLAKIEEKLDEKYVRKEEFLFWRNILVTGLVLTIATGILSNFLKT